MMNRAVVLTRSLDLAYALNDVPHSPFRVVTDINLVGATGGWVFGAPGLRGDIGIHVPRYAGTSNLPVPNGTYFVAWALHPNDPARHFVALEVADFDPVSVIRRTAGLFLTHHSFGASATLPLPGHISAVTDFGGRGLAPPPLGTRPPEPADNDFVRPDPTPGRIPPAAGAPVPRRDIMHGRTTIMGMLRDLAREMGVDPALVLAVTDVESSFDPRALSPKGAMGLMQLMPDTVTLLRVRDPWDPRQNAGGGIALLRLYMKRYGDVDKTLSAYRSGAAGLAKNGISRGDRRYITRVKAKMEIYSRLEDSALVNEGP